MTEQSAEYLRSLRPLVAREAEPPCDHERYARLTEIEPALVPRRRTGSSALLEKAVLLMRIAIHKGVYVQPTPPGCAPWPAEIEVCFWLNALIPMSTELASNMRSLAYARVRREAEQLRAHARQLRALGRDAGADALDAQAEDAELDLRPHAAAATARAQAGGRDPRVSG